MKINTLQILFFILFAFGMYLLINRMLGHSATLELIVSILTGSIYIAIFDLYKSLHSMDANMRERLAKIEKDIEQIKNHILK